MKASYKNLNNIDLEIKRLYEGGNGFQTIADVLDITVSKVIEIPALVRKDIKEVNPKNLAFSVILSILNGKNWKDAKKVVQSTILKYGLYGTCLNKTGKTWLDVNSINATKDNALKILITQSVPNFLGTSSLSQS